MKNSSEFKPYISAATQISEFTLRAVLVGTVLGMVFGASSLYLTLKVGLTVSASIPVAVISLALFRLVSRFGVRDATVLENNIAQTAGSAGESIAFGVGATMPAIMILGFELEMTQVMLVAAIGALLGILMMIPLRRTLIVQEHGKLTYPEGTACAAVLTAGASAESREAAGESEKSPHQQLSARPIFVGFGIGMLYKIMMSALKLWKDVPEKVFAAPFKSASLSAEISPELLGVGYIIGPAVAATMCAGGVLTYLCLIPMIHYFGGGGILPPGTKPIVDMSTGEIRNAYVLYIGAGAVTTAGIVSLIRSLPAIINSLKGGLGFSAGLASRIRTEQDISFKYVLVGIIALVVWIMSAGSLHMNLLGALLLLVFGFVFVDVSSRLTGEIGSSSNPISGMTIATLLLTCLIFVLLGWTGTNYYITALSVGGIVCVATANGGTTSQDLKTGHLLGATPRLQQYAIIVGSLMSVLILGPILMRLNQAATVYVPVQQISQQGIRAPLDELENVTERIEGPQAQSDRNTYRVWHKRDEQGGPSGKYLVNNQGEAVWLVDPGINGRYNTRPDGTEVRKFDAPKATLVSYIIRGVLDRELPWELVLFGAMLALVVEMCGIGSLSFAVGVYLPLATTTPMLVGGLIRWWVDRKQPQSDVSQSGGVLLASGYIAGGAIAGIFIALLAGVFESADAKMTTWAAANNPFFSGPWASGLALIPFLLLAGYLAQAGKRPRNQ